MFTGSGLHKVLSTGVGIKLRGTTSVVQALRLLLAPSCTQERPLKLRRDEIIYRIGVSKEIMNCISILCLFSVFPLILSQLSNDPDQLLNWCLDGMHHKSRPGPEDELFEQVSMKIRNERFYQVPLCESECIAWFSACVDDYTCTDNWVRNLVWNKQGNHCKKGLECKTFKEIFGTAENFCEKVLCLFCLKVWDDSWKYTPDNQPCMKIWFDGEKGNPNDNVTILKHLKDLFLVRDKFYTKQNIKSKEKAYMPVMFR
ncbi:Folate receptor beta [Zootermopsis nevadensis]|uniref:Folate receptor beta n=1 Tax=Zootermopsis nevadensis TaxID=136037 RepID=A0A067QXU6_ZOONE|nr:Folate receptor beta [Zootermopsis nevadensis]